LKPAAPFQDWGWRWVDPPEPPPFYDPGANIREAVVAIARALSRGGVAVTAERTAQDVALFNAVTEKRYVGNNNYQTCGDVVGGTMALAGVRDENVINRDDDNFDGKKDRPGVDMVSWWDVQGTKSWKVGWNITMLRQAAIDIKAWYRKSLPSRGDYFLLDYGTGLEHMGIVICDPLLVGDRHWQVVTVEGGQVDQHGQCVREYVNDLLQQPDGTFVLHRKGGKPRKVDGFADVAAFDYAVPALLPPWAAHIGVEAAVEVE
jgi:hypothetical protein